MESNRSYGQNQLDKLFKSVQKTCRENSVREFHFKYIHRIVVTKKELFRCNIKSDSNCIYCGDLDSIDHTFSECQFTKSFTQDVLQWFNTEKNSKFNPNTEDLLFGIFPSSSTLLKKTKLHPPLSAVLYL